MSLEPKYYRARAKVIENLLSYYKMQLDQDISESDKKYFEKGIRLLRGGFIPKDEKQEVLIKNVLETNKISNSPLSFTELTSFSIWFAMHPEKRAGIELETTSVHFPVKVKGKREDIEKVMEIALGNKSKEKVLKLKAKALKLKLELLNLDNLEGVISDFNNALKQFFAGTFKGRYINLGKPKDELLKCGLSEGNIIITTRQLKKKADQHNLTYNQLKYLPSQLNNPVLVFQSTKYNNSILVFINRINHEGIIQAVIASSVDNQNLELKDINVINSISGRRMEQIETYLHKNLLLAGDEKKFEKILIGSGFNCLKSKNILELLRTKLQQINK